MHGFSTLTDFTEQFPELPDTQLTSSGPAMLVNTLAWAVKNNIPLHEAILCITPKGKPPTEALRLFPPAPNWDRGLEACYADLIEGIPLHATLRKRLGNFLPEYFLNAVQVAEDENRLETVLPHFASRINCLNSLKHSFKRSLVMPITVLGIIVFVFSLLCLFIVPKFVKIGEELLESTPPSLGMTVIESVAQWLQANLLKLILFAGLFVVIYRIAQKPIFWLFDRVMTYVPFLRNTIKHLAIMEFSASMASYLSAGEDLIQAAKFSLKACRYHWLRRKLKHFIGELENGVYWLDAWDNLHLDQPIVNWLIHNSATRDSLPEGFDMILDWTNHQLQRNSRFQLRCFEIACVFFNGLLVGTIAVSFFHILVNAINHLVLLGE